MKISGFIAVILVFAAQVLLFGLTWSGLVAAAADAGREQRGGVAFGVTVHHGAILINLAFLIASSVSASTSRLLVRWSTIGFLAGVWSLWVVPSLSIYPIRGTVFYSLGCLILVVGSGFFVPLVNRAVRLFQEKFS